MADEAQLTRYLVFETDAEGVELRRVGEQNARGSDDALRKFFAEPPIDRDGFYVAVSENSFKLRHVHAKVRTTIGEAAFPPADSTPPAPPDEEGDPADPELPESLTGEA